MRIIRLLTLGLLAGQICISAATTSPQYESKAIYGKKATAGIVDGPALSSNPLATGLMIRPFQMHRVGDCAIDGCNVFFTDEHTVRNLKETPSSPKVYNGVLTTIAGVPGNPGHVDGHIDGGDGDDEDGSGSDCDRSGSEDGYDSDTESKKSRDGLVKTTHGRRSLEALVTELCEKGNLRRGVIDLESGECEINSPRRTKHHGHERRNSMGSEPDNESICSKRAPSFGDCGSGKRPLFNTTFGITSLSDGRLVVSDNGNNAIRTIDLGKGIVFTAVDGIEEPRFLANDGGKKVYATARGKIVEMDFEYQPPRVRTIAEQGYNEDFSACLLDIVNKPATEIDKEIERYERGEFSDCDLDSDAEDDDIVLKRLEAIVDNPIGIDYTVEQYTENDPMNGQVKVNKPTLYYTELDQGRVKKLVYEKSSDSWTNGNKDDGDDGIVAPSAAFHRPTSVFVQQDGSKLVVDKEGVKLIKTGLDGTDTVELIIPADQVPAAISAIECCNGEIYVAHGHVIEVFGKKTQTPVPPGGGGGNTPGGSNAGVLAAAAGAVIKTATEGVPIDEQDFRFGLSTEQIMLTMRQRGVNFAESGSNDSYSKALNAVEKAVDSTHAIRQIGRGMTVWVSGLYTQASLSSMFGNPAMKSKHYAIMAGTHYKDAATQQIFGVAVNVGFGNSISKEDKDARTDNKAAQLTLYYNKKFDEEGRWKFSWHNSLMRSMDRHQRPFTDNRGNRQIAIGNGVTYEFSSIVELSYKHEYCKDNFIKPFTAVSYTYNKEMAYKEKNVDIYNRSYGNASMDQIGLQFGIKSSFGHKISDTKTFVIMPKISYTNFAKMGKVSQTSVNIVSGQTAVGQSGTPGRHLLSATIAIGTVDYEANMTTRFAYTGNIQKNKKSHELMLDWGMKF